MDKINRLRRKIYGCRQSNEDSSMPEESLERRTHREDPHRVERTQALISDNPEQSLRKLASIVELGIISLLDFINRSISIVQKIAFTKSANHFINRRSFLLKMTKSFIKINQRVLFMRAHKGNVTVAMNQDE